MTEESARRLAQALYVPFVSAGLVNQASIDAAARIILSHVELDELREEFKLLQKQVADQAIAPAPSVGPLCDSRMGYGVVTETTRKGRK